MTRIFFSFEKSQCSSFKNAKTTFQPTLVMSCVPSSWMDSLLYVVLLLGFITSCDASNETFPFNGTRLMATSQSIFMLQERLQAPGIVDLRNMTFSVVQDNDEHDDSGGERRIMMHSLESNVGIVSRRKIRKHDKNKQKTIINVPADQDPQSQQELPQQVIEAALVPIPKHCGTNRIWDTIKLPTTNEAAAAGPKKQRHACNWQKLGIGVTIQSSSHGKKNRAGGIHHHFCCSQLTIDKGICNPDQLGRLILKSKIYEGNYQQVAVPAAENGVSSFSWSDDNDDSTDDIIFVTNHTGNHLLILANCLDDGADVLVEGTLVFNSSLNGTDGNPKSGFENLVNSIKEGPQSKKPKFPEDGLVQIWVFGAMGTVYLLLGLCWCCYKRCHQPHAKKVTDSLDIARERFLSTVLFVASLYLFLSAADLYVWGTRSGSLHLWVWDGSLDGPERDYILRYIALALCAFKAGMTRWLVLVQILLVPTSSTANQRIAQRTRLKVTLLIIIYTNLCITWGIVAAIAKDNLHNMKMFMDGEEKRWLKALAIIAACALLLDAWAYFWALCRFMQQCCGFQQYRQSNRYSNRAILALVTALGIFIIYTMTDLVTRNHKLDALFVWDDGNIRILTEATYFVVLSCLQSPLSERSSIPTDDSCNMDKESKSDDSNVNGIAEEAKSPEVEMAPLIP